MTKKKVYIKITFYEWVFFQSCPHNWDKHAEVHFQHNFDNRYIRGNKSWLHYFPLGAVEGNFHIGVSFVTWGIGLRVEYGVEGTVNHFINFSTRAPFFPVLGLILILWGFELHFTIHKNNGHYLTDLSCCIGSRTMENPPRMKANIPKIKGGAMLFKIGEAQELAQFFFAFISDF